MRAALVQMTSGDAPEDNILAASGYIRDAARQGAQCVLTPEVTNCVTFDRDRQRATLRGEKADPALAAFRALAAELDIWLVIGSLALTTDDPDGRFANRSFLIAPDGAVAARYDKIHMFDVTVSPTETYRESDAYRPGRQAVLADMGGVRLGMTICYDIRFPALYQALARAGAQVLTAPSAFSEVTGAAHWESLLRARAIETGCYVLAPAQTGAHPVRSGRARRTYGHSMAVSPWGEILVDAGTEPGVSLVDLDFSAVTEARRRVPALANAQDFDGPL